MLLVSANGAGSNTTLIPSSTFNMSAVSIRTLGLITLRTMFWTQRVAGGAPGADERRIFGRRNESCVLMC